eukprot:TRINITY_DN12980_c0_g2_i1.p1 TRINITY_DN12980_c0_g2~~TRINITY_DN12980_c0_g2_i1.p1  ORF type:complete len:571 (+),score=105.14 TRINITY_DN12980_c0_g2_i1:102-1814(+)
MVLITDAVRGGPMGGLLRIGSNPRLSLSLMQTVDQPKGQRKVFQEDSKRRTQKSQKFVGEESTLRRLLRAFIENTYFDLALGLVIIINLFVTILETDERLQKGVSEYVSYAFFAVYATELLLKAFVQRAEFCRDCMNIMDCTIVMVDAIFIAMASLASNTGRSLGHLRSFRLIRLLRVLRAVRAFRELNQLLHAFAGAVRAVVWGVMLIFIILIIYAVLAVQLIDPVVQRILERDPDMYGSCSRCWVAYSSVFNSVMTFAWQCLGSESWGNTLPIIEESPMTFLFFFSLLITVQLIMLNLVLAVTMQAAMSSTITDLDSEAQRVVGEQMEAESAMLELASQLDSDGSSTLSEKEFIDGFHENKQFQSSMGVLGVTEDDIHFVFKLCDVEESGQVGYEDFVVQLSRMKLRMDQLLLTEVMKTRSEIAQLRKGIRDSTEKTVESVIERSKATTAASGSITGPLESLMSVAGTTQNIISSQHASPVASPVARSDDAKLRDCGGDSLQDWDLSLLTLPNKDTCAPTLEEMQAPYYQRAVPATPSKMVRVLDVAKDSVVDSQGTCKRATEGYPEG